MAGRDTSGASLIELLTPRPKPASRAERRRRAKGHRGALRLLAEVMGLEHLHYGLWDGESFTLEGLTSAQRRYTERLIELIPPGTSSILDCGCGTGATALRLGELGYEVDGLTPDASHEERFRARTGRPCHLTPFQSFAPQRRYDLVLMSESCNYIPVDQIFGAVKRAAPGGSWLLADLFTLCKDGSALTKSGHLRSAFLGEAERAGLVLEHEEDITEGVLPTLEMARDIVEDKALPAARLLAEWLADRYPRLGPPAIRGALFLLRRPLAKAEAQRVLIDAEAFREAKRYMIYRYSVPGEGALRT